MSATRSGPPARPSVKRPRPGIGIGSEPQQHAERHAEADRHVRHLGRRLDGIAEMPSQRRHGLPRRDHRHAVAVLEHQTGIGRAARRRRGALRRSWRRCRPGNVIPPIGTPVSAARETKNLAMSSALRSLATCPASTRPSCCCAWSSAADSPNSSRPSPASSRICGSGSLFVRPCRTATTCTPGGRPAITSPSVVPGLLGGQHDLDGGGRRRRRRQAGSHEAREDEDAEDGRDDADRIRDGVPDGGRAIAGGIDGGLQRRRAGQRAGEHAQRVRGRDAERARPRPDATPSAHNTPTAPSAFHFSPDPRKPAKNCRPYWMPMP